MPFKYSIYYWYRDPQYNHEWSGVWYCNDLVDVYAFTDMVKAYGGRASCSI